MKITFWGATRQVTGSMFLLSFDDGYKVLVDCGIDIENHTETQPAYPNSLFPFEPNNIHLVVLTHAHIDHSGKIPNLLREGYEGQILCTSPTIALTELLLLDSAKINQKKLERYHKHKYKEAGKKKNNNFKTESTYLEKDVNEVIEQFVPIAFNKRFQIKNDLAVTFIPTGHLLGAANIYFEWKEKGQQQSILFSGDIGRKNYPLLPDPTPCPQAEYLVCETTYSSRHHRDEDDKIIREIIQKACVDVPGRLIIPAFSVGRTQAILYTLNRLWEKGKLPPIKIFTDSTMAFKANSIYERYARFVSGEARAFKKLNGTLFDFDNLTYLEDIKKSKQVSNYSEPCIIISSSGMLQGGRIRHHIYKNLQNPYCSILFIGFCAEGTLGHTLLNSNGSLKSGKQNIPIHAQILYTDILSGHGDKNDLMNFIGRQDPEKIKNIFLVHGEKKSMESFKEGLHAENYDSVIIPKKGESFELVKNSKK